MKKFPSKIFIDGGLPEETRKANEILLEKFNRPLDGQTTNPTLIAKNLRQRMREGNIEPKDTSNGGRLSPPSGGRSHDSFEVERSVKPSSLTQEQALSEYKRIVQEMSAIIPAGSVSIQVFANQETKSEEMLKQARERHSWIPNSSIKLPCTHEGLKTAEIVCREFPVNITLVFSQSQAAAVYEATKGAKYPVFISPFVGRLDDRGEDGMDVVSDILKMYEKGRSASGRTGGHVEVLTASVRNLGHIFRAFSLKSDIVTIPFKIFKEWVDTGFQTAPKTPRLWRGGEISKALKEIPYQQHITPGKPWQEYDLSHDLTDKGVTSFWEDWMELFSNTPGVL